MNRGEIWWGETPDAGRRPYLIMSRQGVVSALQRVIAAPVTTIARGLPSELPLDESDGMPRPCVVAFDNISHHAKAQLTERICTLGADRMHDACRALAIATGCRPW